MDEAVSKHAGFAQMNFTALFTTESKRKDGVLAFFFYPFQEMSANSSRAILVFVKEEYFIELINSISISPINQVVLLDSSGNGILSTDPSILSDEWDLSFFQENLFCRHLMKADGCVGRWTEKATILPIRRRIF